jgi:hypothetical protein
MQAGFSKSIKVMTGLLVRIMASLVIGLSENALQVTCLYVDHHVLQ